MKVPFKICLAEKSLNYFYTDQTLEYDFEELTVYIIGLLAVAVVFSYGIL